MTYSELRRDAELLTYLCNNKIRSVEDLQNIVNVAAEKFDRLKKSREKLLREIEERENIDYMGAFPKIMTMSTIIPIMTGRHQGLLMK